MTWKRVVLICSCIVALGGVSAVAGVRHYLHTPALPGSKGQIFVVKEGMTLKDVVGDLERRGIIRGGRVLVFWARVKKLGARIKAGEYVLGAGMAPVQILDMLTKGKILTHAVTVPEGFTSEQIAVLLAEKRLAEKAAFLAIADSPEAARAYGLGSPGLEGYLFPDTYHFARGLSARTIVDAMVARFRAVVEPLREAIEASGMTLEEVTSLASIVEKETGLAEERPLIAGVFLNRLKRGMRLESDPTVIYGLKDFDGNLTRQDLEQPTPYNTYLIRGLPPGPIASPGAEAIKAVLFPAKTDYLYFVSKNDGSHHFSKSLEEHTRAVQMYQKSRRHRTKKAS